MSVEINTRVRNFFNDCGRHVQALEQRIAELEQLVRTGWKPSGVEKEIDQAEGFLKAMQSDVKHLNWKASDKGLCWTRFLEQRTQINKLACEIWNLRLQAMQNSERRTIAASWKVTGTNKI